MVPLAAFFMCIAFIHSVQDVGWGGEQKWRGEKGGREGGEMGGKGKEKRGGRDME